MHQSIMSGKRVEREMVCRSRISLRVVGEVGGARAVAQPAI